VKQLKRVAEKEEHVEAKRLQLPEQQWDLLDVESFKQQLKGNNYNNCLSVSLTVNDDILVILLNSV